MDRRIGSAVGFILGHVARLAIFALADGGLLLLAWTAWAVLRIGPAMPTPPIGNFPGTLAALPTKDPAAPIRFAVMSDIQEGVSTFRAAQRVLADRRPDFVVLNGDLAYRPREEAYRYFLSALRDSPYAGPFFCVVGDHDLVGRTDPSLFRRHFGEDRFAFRYGACQFLLVNDCLGPLKADDYAWIEAEAARAPDARHRFLFMHVPPLDAPKGVEVVSAVPRYRRLYALAPALKIRRVFSGNLHAYRRIEIEGVPYVVCGGGGAKFQSPEAFHHYVEVTVEGDAVRDEVVRLPTVRGPGDDLDRFTFIDVWPPLRDHPALAVALAVLVCAGVFWQVRLATRRLAGGASRGSRSQEAVPPEPAAARPPSREKPCAPS